MYPVVILKLANPGIVRASLTVAFKPFRQCFIIRQVQNTYFALYKYKTTLRSGIWGKKRNKQHSDSIKSLMRALVPKLFTVYSMCSSVSELLILNVVFVIQIFFFF